VGCNCGNDLLFSTGVDSVLDGLVAQEAVGGNADAIYLFIYFCFFLKKKEDILKIKKLITLSIQITI